jgi:UDP-N-acetylmuramyl pentapeptide phosphotransferase/UDP-N-acetylglucosamine-1-phosphate transferase
MIAGACVGFLTLNLPPAKVFMGDSGSTILGFFAASVGAFGAAKGDWSPLFGFLVFFPFVYDSGITLLTRIAKRKRFWEAHREHLYQQAVLAGIPRGFVLLIYAVLMLVSATVALYFKDGNFMTQMGGLVALTCLHGAFQATLRRYS